MMKTAPIAPSAPANVAVAVPIGLKLRISPCDVSTPAGTSTPIRKYATPTHNSARIGLPSATCPRCSDAPYMPQESAAPNARAIHDMKLSPFGPKTGPLQGSSVVGPPPLAPTNTATAGQGKPPCTDRLIGCT